MLMEVETPSEFAQKHTVEGPPVVDPQTNRELYADGAVRFEHGFVDPPVDNPSVLLRLKRKYWYLRYNEEREAFENFRANEIAQASHAARYAAAGSVPTPGTDSVEQLKAGKSRVEKLLAKVKALDAEIYNLPESVVARRQAEIIQERHQLAQQRIAQLQAVNLDDLEGVSA